MKTYWCFLIFAFTCDGFTQDIHASSDNSSKLVAVVVISRHGDRSPVYSFPSDKFFNESYWPNGLDGEMTELGIERLYKLGQWLRERYNHFLSDIYSPKEIYAYSPDLTRCLTSITASLAGLYPPKGHQIWNVELLWRPIPVHSTNIENDELFTHNRFCPKYNELYDNAKQTKLTFFKNKYSSFFEFIGEKSGYENVEWNHISTFKSVFNLYMSYNATFLPEWYKEIDQDLLHHLAGRKEAIPTTTPELTRLRVGPFYDFVFKYFDKFVKPTSDMPPAKFLLISSPHSSMASILDGMKCLKKIPLEFGDTLMWELRQKDGQYSFNLLYKQNDKLEQVDCCINCDYMEFKRNLTDVIVDIRQWKKECFFV